MVLAVIGLAAFTSYNSNAQFIKGIKAGYNSAALGFSNMDGIDEVKARHGFHAGGFAGFKLAIITIQLDAVYSQQGATLTSGTDELEVKNNYLNIPVVGKINLGPINLQAGLQYGFLISSKLNDVKDEDGFFYKKSDFGIPVGVGVDISKLMLEARYVIGIANINNTSDDDTIANGVLQISAGIKF